MSACSIPLRSIMYKRGHGRYYWRQFGWLRWWWFWLWKIFSIYLIKEFLWDITLDYFLLSCIHGLVVVIMFDFHRNDRGSNPWWRRWIFIMIPTTLQWDTIGKCLKTICHGFTEAMWRNLGRWKLLDNHRSKGKWVYSLGIFPRAVTPASPVGPVRPP